MKNSKALSFIGLTVVLLVSVIVASLLLTVPVKAVTVITLPWNGQGNGNADPNCHDGQVAFWEWILTPGGNNDFDWGTLTVNYDDGSQTVTNGQFPGGDHGAIHFYVTNNYWTAVVSASVQFEYEGESDNFVLTISSSECQGPVNTPTPQPSDTPTPTSTSTLVPSPTPTTPVYTPTSTYTQTPGPSPTATNTPTATYTQTPGPSPTPTKTNTPRPSPTNTPGPSLTPTSGPSSTPSTTPIPPQPGLADINIYQGRLVGTLMIKDDLFSVFIGGDFDGDTVLDLPPTGGAYYSSVIYMHRIQEEASDWLRLNLGDPVTFYYNGQIYEYIVTGDHYMGYGVYPISSGVLQFVASCYSDRNGWAGLELYQVQLIRIVNPYARHFSN